MTTVVGLPCSVLLRSIVQITEAKFEAKQYATEPQRETDYEILLFNITVLTALAYLVFDNGEMHKISNKIQKSSFDAIEK